jgi:hypothetical protein
MFLFLSLLAMFCIFLLVVRNYFVREERLRMIDVIFAQKNWEYYRGFLNVVSYDTMVMQFWVWPVSKMWPQELKDLK